MDGLTFIDHLVGRLVWPAVVVTVAWAARGPLLALAGRHGRSPASPSGTGDEADTAAAEHKKPAGADGDARADQAALLGFAAVIGLCSTVALALGRAGLVVALAAFVIGAIVWRPRKSAFHNPI